MSSTKQEIFSKAPEVTLLFWITKIFATTLGETGGDAVSMSMNLGYLVGTGIFSVIEDKVKEAATSCPVEAIIIE